MPDDDPLVFALEISNCLVKRILVDGGNAVKVMFYSTFKYIRLPDEEIVQALTPLVGFHRASMISMGTIWLEVTARKKLLMVEFVIINALSPHNAIMGRGRIHSMKGILLTLH